MYRLTQMPNVHCTTKYKLWPFYAKQEKKRGMKLLWSLQQILPSIYAIIKNKNVASADKLLMIPRMNCVCQLWSNINPFQHGLFLTSNIFSIFTSTFQCFCQAAALKMDRSDTVTCSDHTEGVRRCRSLSWKPLLHCTLSPQHLCLLRNVISCLCIKEKENTIT